MYTDIYAHSIYIYMYTYIEIYTHEYINIYVYIYIHIYIYIYIYMHTYADINAHVSVFMQSRQAGVAGPAAEPHHHAESGSAQEHSQ